MDFGHSQAVATEAGQGPVPPLPTPLRPKSAQSRVMRPLREFAALPAQLRTSVRSCAGALRCSRSGFHLCDYLSAMCSSVVSVKSVTYFFNFPEYQICIGSPFKWLWISVVYFDKTVDRLSE